MEHLEEFSVESPDAHAPTLAATLITLAAGLAETGADSEAITAAERAVEIRMEFARANPAVEKLRLARAMQTLTGFAARALKGRAAKRRPQQRDDQRCAAGSPECPPRRP